MDSSNNTSKLKPTPSKIKDTREQPPLQWQQLSTVEMKPIVFVDKPLWQANAFHLLVGKKNAGKGTYLSAVAAQFTRGEFGDENRNVAWIAAGEDSLAIDVRPRIEAAGGDSSRVFCPIGVPKLPGAAEQIREWIAATGNVGLVVLDPVSGMMGAGKDSNKDTDVRQALEVLNTLADDMRCVIVGVRHLKKDLSQGALAAVLGSVDWVNVPRAVIGIVKDKADGLRHVQALTGNRSADDTTSRAFEIAGVNVVEGGDPVAKAVFVEGAGRDIEEILMADKQDVNTLREQAKKAILEVLEAEQGEEGLPSDKLETAILERGFRGGTIKKAKDELKAERMIQYDPLKDEAGKIKEWRVKTTGMKVTRATVIQFPIPPEAVKPRKKRA